MNISTTTTKRLSRFATIDNVATADLPSFKNLVSLKNATASKTKKNLIDLFCSMHRILSVSSVESEQNSGQGVRSFNPRLGLLKSLNFNSSSMSQNLNSRLSIISSLLFALLITHSSFVSAQRTFAPAVNYPTGSSTYSVAIGDLNGDGRPDLAVANLFSNTVSVLTSTSSGTFGAKVDYATGVNPRSVAIGDLNGDGRPDLAVANYNSNTVSVLTSTGSGTFGAKVDYATGSAPYSVAIGDFNGDGRPDLAVANGNSNTVSVLTSTGSGTFGAKVDYPTGSGPYSVAIGDLNGDGRPDLAVANGNSNTVSVLTSTGSGTFGAKVDYVTGAVPRSVAIGDLNGDGRPDLAVANGNSNTVSVLTSTGSGTFGAAVDYPTGSYPSSVAIGDLNGDGRPDLAVANLNSSTVSVLTSTGSGFGAKVDYTTGAFPYSVAIGNLNGDGRPDLAVVKSNSNTVSVLLAQEMQFISNFAVSNQVYGTTFAFTATATSGLAVSYSSSNASLLNIVGNAATATGVGVVTVTAFQNGNATFAGVTLTGVLTITQANLTVQGNNFTKVYGSVNPIFTGTVLGIRNNDIITPSFSTTATSLSGVGVYQIMATATGSNINNYALIINNSVLTITQANLTVQGFNATKVYGSVNPMFTGTVLGIRNNDIITPSFSTTATSLSGVGVYQIMATATGSNINNYALIINNSVLTITQANLTVQGNNFSKVYGSVNPVFTGTVLGIRNNDIITPSFSTTATSLSGVGVYQIMATATGSNINNYALIINNSVLTITKANLTVQGNNFSKVYGSVNPIFTGTVLGIRNNDIITPSFSTTATSLSGVGVYQIMATATGLNINNYTLIINNSQLTITQANLTVQGNNFSKVYGSDNPIFTGTVLGIRNNDIITPSFSTTATSLSGVGVYQIMATATGSNVNNYALIINNSVLTITQANLTVQGNNFSKVYGSDNPIFTGTVLGIRNNDIITPSFSTTATSLSGVGVYQIMATATGSNINNYALTINNSVLTITSLAFVSTAASPIVFNSTVFDGSPKIPSVVGLPSTSGVNYTYNGSSTAPTNAGSYTVVGIITDPNYTGTVTSVIVISPSDLSNQISVAGLSNSVYDSSPKPTSITGLPSGVASTITYNGSPTAPTNAGSYTVVGIITDPNYTGTVTSVIVISPSDLSNQISVAGLSNSMYDGSPKSTSITGLPFGVASTITYNGSSTAPTNAGSYTVEGIITDPNYTGTVTSVMVISQSNISNQLSVAGLSNSMYDGLPKTMSITGLPLGVASTITYNGSSTAPSNAGSYTVVGIVNDANYVGTTTSIMVISPVLATITAFNATKTYGAAHPIFTGSIARIANNDVITPSFSTLATSLSGVGNYVISATASGLNINNYEFIINNSQLSIIKANATITAFNATKTYGAANPIFTGSMAGIVNGDMISALYGSEATQTSNVGNYAITATATGVNINNYELIINNSVLTISEAASSVSISGASANGALVSATIITISGVGFESRAMITVNGVAIQNFTVVSGTTIIANISANTLSTTGNVILVQNPNQQASANAPVVITDATLNISYELLIINYELSIVPNPTLGEFKIQNAEIGSDLLIFNAQGAVVFSQIIIEETTSISATLSSGIYLVKVGNKSKKLIYNY